MFIEAHNYIRELSKSCNCKEKLNELLNEQDKFENYLRVIGLNEEWFSNVTIMEEIKKEMYKKILQEDTIIDESGIVSFDDDETCFEHRMHLDGDIFYLEHPSNPGLIKRCKFIKNKNKDSLGRVVIYDYTKDDKKVITVDKDGIVISEITLGKTGYKDYNVKGIKTRDIKNKIIKIYDVDKEDVVINDDFGYPLNLDTELSSYSMLDMARLEELYPAYSNWLKNNKYNLSELIMKQISELDEEIKTVESKYIDNLIYMDDIESQNSYMASLLDYLTVKIIACKKIGQKFINKAKKMASPNNIALNQLIAILSGDNLDIEYSRRDYESITKIIDKYETDYINESDLQDNYLALLECKKKILDAYHTKCNLSESDKVQINIIYERNLQILESFVDVLDHLSKRYKVINGFDGINDELNEIKGKRIK